MSRTYCAFPASLAAALFVSGAVYTALAHDTKAAGKRTFVAHVVDLACYAGHGSIGDSHGGCATACAKTGIPLAILDQQAQTLYMPLSKDHHAAANAELMPFVEKGSRDRNGVREGRPENHCAEVDRGREVRVTGGSA